MRQKRRSYREPDDEDVYEDDFAAVNERLDGLTRQLERMAQANAPQPLPAPASAPAAPPIPPAPPTSDRVAEALARLDRRLDQVIADGRAAASNFHQPRYALPPGPIPIAMMPQGYAPPAPVHAPPPVPTYAPPPGPAPVYAGPPPLYAGPPPAPVHAPSRASIHAAPPPPSLPSAPPQPARTSAGPAGWAAQISARQRMLDGGPATSVPATPAPKPVMPPPQPVMAAPQATIPAPPPAPPPPPPMPMPAPAQPSWGPSPELAGVEHQLREINSQISSLHQPYESAFAALRNDLAEIAKALNEALPQRAIETLENEVRSLADRIGRTKQAGADGTALAAIESEIAEVRNTLQHLTPAESLAGFHEAVHALSRKIDQLGATAAAPQDPLAFKQLEQAVVSLRGVVSNVASDGALAQLAAEVRGLAAQFERAAADSSTEALGRLESRITALMESGRSVPPELEGTIRELSVKLDRMTLSHGDQLALSALEDRIAKLAEKLDASDARLGQLDAIERGLAELLVHLEEIRKGGGGRGLRAPEPPEPVAVSTAPSPSAKRAVPVLVPSPLDLIPEQPQPTAAPVSPPPPSPPAASPPAEAFTPPPAAPTPPEPSAPPPPPAAIAAAPPERARPPVQMPRGPVRRPIDPNLPPDSPLEPGSGVPRVKPGSAAARIAASEAALGNSRLLAAETGGKAAAIAAARNAARAAYVDTPVKVPKSLGPKLGGRLKWPFKKKDKLAPEAEVEAPPLAPALPLAPTLPPTQTAIAEPAEDHAFENAPMSRGRRILGILKKILIAASVAIIVVGTAQTAIEMLFPAKPASSESQSPGAQSEKLASPPPVTKSVPATTPGRPMPTPEGALPPAQAPAPMPPAADTEPTNSINKSLFDPTTVIKVPDVTGSIPRKPAPHRSAPSAPGRVTADMLPASISPVLRTALFAKNPAAEYELGARYAEGRSVPQNFVEAAAWLQRAADAGFAPAQFRLASLYEKGEGLKKDVQAARRLYLDAAQQGHAKAMHNLAVLYAVGLDGKPDYKTAAEWFRKAAGYGVGDSQYNLAILYARGIGVPANLAEAYRWFALAAAKGDRDAAHKRDEVAARLDEKTVMAAKLAAQSFVADREPEDAVNLDVPPGGWDQAPAAKPRRQTSAR